MPNHKKVKSTQKPVSIPGTVSKKKQGSSVLTRPLGLLGWERLEPVLLAALATREPLLLIGKHGTAKSFLPERLAQGPPLEKLSYRWAAMNPPPTDDVDGDVYLGAESLDPALAERFSIKQIVRDLELTERDWRADLLRGYFAHPTHSWER
jgi:hypothetical protein